MLRTQSIKLGSNARWNADVGCGRETCHGGGGVCCRRCRQQGEAVVYDLLIAAVIICAESGAIPRNALRGCVTDTGRDA